MMRSVSDDNIMKEKSKANIYIFASLSPSDDQVRKVVLRQVPPMMKIESLCPR